MGWAAKHREGLIGLGAYALIWGAAIALLAGLGSGAVGDGVAVMAFMGVGFSALAWLVTLGERAPEAPVRRPGFELLAVLIYLAAYAVLFTGWGLSAFHAAFRTGRLEAVLLLGLKLLVHVAGPALLVLAVGGELRPLMRARINTRGFWLGLIVIGAAVVGLTLLITPSLKQLAGLHAAAPMLAITIGGSFVWLAIEAGLCEEFLFRAVLQTRLAAVFNSETAAVATAALVFALVHVPGLWMRDGASVAGHSANLVQVIAYAIAVLSPAGLFLGFVWARTRSLLLVVLLHACVDALPNAADFARTWLGY